MTAAIANALPASSRYELLVRVAAGGMATVYVGRLRGALGFSRLVAIKRAHPHLLEDTAFARMLVAEARTAARIHHPNVVSVMDVEELDGELLLIMDYVEGASLSGLLAQAAAQKKSMPIAIAARIVVDACAGLHAAHQVADDQGKLLGLVHRDVSPHNVLVGVDGSSRLADFGIAKVESTSSIQTSTGALKGKVAYMAPEYVEKARADVRSDVFGMGVVAWEAFTQKRLFRGENEIETLRLVLAAEVPRASSVAELPRSIDLVLEKALHRDPDQRFQTAAEFSSALDEAARAASLIAGGAELGALVQSLVGPGLEQRRATIRSKTQPQTESLPPSAPVTSEAPAAAAPASSASDNPLRTVTLPTVTPPDATSPEVTAQLGLASERRVEVVSSGSSLGEGTTTGAAARSVREARQSRSPRAMRARWASVSVIVVAAGLAGTAAIVWRVRSASTAPAQSAVSSMSATSAAAAPASPPSVVSAAGSATPPPTTMPSASVAVAAVAPPPAPSAAAAASGKATAAPRPRASAAAASPAGRDKAPPNPYSH